MEILNVSKEVDVGGVSYMLNLDQKLSFPAAPSAMTHAQWDDVFNTLIAHPKRRPMTAQQFRRPRRFHCSVVDNQRYDTFYPHHGAMTADAWFDNIATWTSAVSVLTSGAHAMNTLIYLVEKPPVTQTYVYTTYAQAITRWPASSITARLMRPIPVATHGQVVDERLRAERDHNGLG